MVWAAGAGAAARWAAAAVELAAAYNLAVAVAYDHRMLACGAVTLLHITLLCSMAFCGDLDPGAGGRPDARPDGALADAAVDGVIVTIALESMMIQMLGGVLVLMGLKQVGMFYRSILGVGLVASSSPRGFFLFLAPNRRFRWVHVHARAPM